MASHARLDVVRRTFADLTGALEDAAVLTAEGQASRVDEHRQRDGLLAAVSLIVVRLHRLMRRLE